MKVLSERYIVNAAARTNDVGKTVGVPRVCLICNDTWFVAKDSMFDYRHEVEDFCFQEL